jgi:heptaprenyl diphosphate synthase
MTCKAGGHLDLRSVFADIAADLSDVESYMAQLLDEGPQAVRDVALHLLRAGGKRLRPALVLFGAKFGDYAYEDVRPVAAAAELIHMATLAHDDVIDRAELRRGRPTVHSLWGEHTAVLTGDYLFAKAFSLLSEVRVGKVVGIMADVVYRMCSGEIAQNVQSRDRVLPNEDQYLDRIAQKTAVFIAESCRAGAAATGAPLDVQQALYDYGYSMGMGFQIIDDLLDLTAEPKTLGKAIGSDLRAHVITLPLIHGLRQSQRRAELQTIAESTEVTGDSVNTAREILGQAGSFSYAEELAYRFIDTAKRSIRPLIDVPAKASLLAMADFVLERQL